jgi:hypothetical protein
VTGKENGAGVLAITVVVVVVLVVMVVLDTVVRTGSGEVAV